MWYKGMMQRNQKQIYETGQFLPYQLLLTVRRTFYTLIFARLRGVCLAMTARPRANTFAGTDIPPSPLRKPSESHLTPPLLILPPLDTTRSPPNGSSSSIVFTARSRAATFDSSQRPSPRLSVADELDDCPMSPVLKDCLNSLVASPHPPG